MRRLVVILILFALLAGGSTWYFAVFCLDHMMERQIESKGTQLFGVQVNVKQLQTNIVNGFLEISEITIENPEGYLSAAALSLGNIHVDVDYAKWAITQLVIDKPNAIIEEIEGKTNFDHILDSLERSAPESGSGTGTKSSLVVQHVQVNKFRAAFVSASLDRRTEFEIGAVEMTDIRGTPFNVAQTIALEVVHEIQSRATTELLKAQARQKLENVNQQVDARLKELFDKK